MSPLTPKELSLLDLMRTKPDLHPFFFKHASGLKWFDALRTEGYFDTEGNPAFGESPNETEPVLPWFVVVYLQKSAPELAQTGYAEYSKQYMSILRAATAASDNFVASKYRTWWVFSEVLEFVAIDALEPSDEQMFRVWLNEPGGVEMCAAALGSRLLPRLLRSGVAVSRDLGLNLFDLLIEIQDEPPCESGIYLHRKRLRYGKHYAAKMFERSRVEEFGDILGEQLLEIIRERLEESLDDSERGNLSAIWRPSIDDHEQNLSSDDASDILITIFRDCVYGYVARRPAMARKYLNRLLSSEIEPVVRVAIHTISQFPQDLESLVIPTLTARYMSAGCRRETFVLLRRAWRSLEPAQKSEVLSEIESVATGSPDPERDPDVREIQSAYEALRWLAALRDVDDSDVRLLRERYLSVTGGNEDDHPDFSSYTTTWRGGRESPLAVPEILSLEVDEIIEELNHFEEEPGFDTPSEEGFSAALLDALKTQPRHFERKLRLFASVDAEYITAVLRAYKDLWDRESPYGNWSELLSFCQMLIDDDSFWSSASDEQLKYGQRPGERIGDAIAELLIAGTRSDENAVESRHFDAVEGLIGSLLHRLRPTLMESAKDPIMRVINSPRGKTLEALVDFSLLLARAATRDGGDDARADLWATRLSAHFNAEISRPALENREFRTVAAMFHPNLMYLGRTWMLENLERLFDKTDRIGWQCALGGFARPTSTNREIFTFLCEGGHILGGLDAEDLASSAKDRLIEHLTLAYLDGTQRLDDSGGILNAVITRCRVTELGHMIWTIWRFRDSEIKPSFDTHVLPMWKRILLCDEESREELLSNLCLWMVYVDRLDDDVLPLLAETLPFANRDHNAHFVVEELKRLSEDFPTDVARLYLRILERFMLDYPQEQIELTLERMYFGGVDSREIFEDIVERYIHAGIEFPSELRARLRLKAD